MTHQFDFLASSVFKNTEGIFLNLLCFSEYFYSITLPCLILKAKLPNRPGHSPSEPLIPNQILYFNTFRGKPAISEFDWHFTTNHNSLQIFTTITYSIFQFFV